MIKFQPPRKTTPRPPDRTDKVLRWGFRGVLLSGVMLGGGFLLESDLLMWIGGILLVPSWLATFGAMLVGGIAWHSRAMRDSVIYGDLYRDIYGPESGALDKTRNE